jgi:hypothetical protein
MQWNEKKINPHIAYEGFDPPQLLHLLSPRQAPSRALVKWPWVVIRVRENGGPGEVAMGPHKSKREWRPNVCVTPRVNGALTIFIKTLIKDLIKWFILF